jgi:hypothetical protein
LAGKLKRFAPTGSLDSIFALKWLAKYLQLGPLSNIEVRPFLHLSSAARLSL